MLTARYRSYFHKKLKGAYASPIGFLYYIFYGELIDFQQKRHLAYAEHILASNY